MLNSKTKKTIVLIVIVILIGVLVFLLIKNKKPQIADSQLESQTNIQDPNQPLSEISGDQISKDTSFLVTLLGLTKITIDPMIFSSNLFINLRDNTVEIISEKNPGRPNPFTPFEENKKITSSNISVPDVPAQNNNNKIKR